MANINTGVEGGGFRQTREEELRTRSLGRLVQAGPRKHRHAATRKRKGCGKSPRPTDGVDQ
jgi:hypothetical protein